MTRREMLIECRKGVVRNLPHVLGFAGGLLAELGPTTQPHLSRVAAEAAACFPPAAVVPAADVTESDDAGEEGS